MLRGGRSRRAGGRLRSAHGSRPHRGPERAHRARGAQAGRVELAARLSAADRRPDTGGRLQSELAEGLAAQDLRCSGQAPQAPRIASGLEVWGRGLERSDQGRSRDCGPSCEPYARRWLLPRGDEGLHLRTFRSPTKCSLEALLRSFEASQEPRLREAHHLHPGRAGVWREPRRVWMDRGPEELWRYLVAPVESQDRQGTHHTEDQVGAKTQKTTAPK